MTGDYLASDPLCWKNLNAGRTSCFCRWMQRRLVPHKPPMLLIDRLLEVKERASVSEMTVQADMIFVNGAGHSMTPPIRRSFRRPSPPRKGSASSGAAIHSQEGLPARRQEPRDPRHARVGDTLRISVFKVAKYGDFGIIQGEVTKGEELIARGEVKVWQSDNGSG